MFKTIGKTGLWLGEHFSGFQYGFIQIVCRLWSAYVRIVWCHNPIVHCSQLYQHALYLPTRHFTVYLPPPQPPSPLRPRALAPSTLM